MEEVRGLGRGLEDLGRGLEEQGQLVGWLSGRTDQLELRSTEHGRLLQGQLRDVAENIREITTLAEQLARLEVTRERHD